MINHLVKLASFCCVLVFFSSCASYQKASPKQPNWLDRWESSSSLCLDGLYLNFVKTECESIQMEKTQQNIMWLKCLKTNTKKSDFYWTKNIFIAIPRVIVDNKSSKLKISVRLTCSDSKLYLGKIVERVPNADLQEK